MAISFAKALGIHDDALALREQRAEVLANNIANADTPGFKARDIDFAQQLQQAQAQRQPGNLALTVTDSRHLNATVNPDFAADLMYRIPLQPAVDDNSVEVQQEMARYADNALHYQASFDFLNRKFKGMTNALKGE